MMTVVPTASAALEIIGQKPSVSAILMINLPPISARAAGFRARAENPDAAGGTSGLTDPVTRPAVAPEKPPFRDF
jgi:hypothetical protein